MHRSAALNFAAALVVAACSGSTDQTTGDGMAADSASTAITIPSAGAQPESAIPSAGAQPESAIPSADAQPASPDATPVTSDTAGEAEGDVAGAIPSAFHGEWNAELAACGTGANPTRLRISADRLHFYESTGVVRGVEIESDRVITVTAEYQGEGDTWQEERRLSLSQDGEQLTLIDHSELVRYRCP